jgi:hypothetical protein
MPRRIFLFCVLLASASLAQSQLSIEQMIYFDQVVAARVTIDTTSVPNVWQYSWNSSPGKYFIAQMSTDLVNWTTLSGYAANGTGSRVGVNVSAENLPNIFFRLAILDPSQSVSAAEDTDGNGLPDVWEMFYFGHLGVDPNADPDNDGLTNLMEFRNGTNPLAADTDGDGIPDLVEVKLGTNPNVAGQVDTNNTIQLKITKPQQ